jgi:hypothetical protein
VSSPGRLDGMIGTASAAQQPASPWPTRRRSPAACPPHLHARCLPAVNKAQSVQAFGGKRPVLGSNVFVAPSASVVGDVQLGSGSSVWYGAIIRGECSNTCFCEG